MAARPSVARIASVSIAVALAVMAMKYIAYLKTGSVALYSDALESIVNVITAIVAVVAIRISDRPADRQHQFGHHKAEYFSAVVEGALIIVAALLILNEAFHTLLYPRPLRQPAQGLLISALASVLNGAWAWYLVTRGRRWRSPALAADGWHLFTDVLTSAGVIIGLVLATLTGLTVLDPLLAAAVAVHILWIGWTLMQGSASGLMDEAVDADVAAEIRRIITESAVGALQVHDIRTRVAGPVTFIEFHLVVPGSMSVEASHAICDRIEEALEASIDGANVVIHVEPEREAKSRGAVPV